MSIWNGFDRYDVEAHRDEIAAERAEHEREALAEVEVAKSPLDWVVGSRPGQGKSLDAARALNTPPKSGDRVRHFGSGGTGTVVSVDVDPLGQGTVEIRWDSGRTGRKSVESVRKIGAEQ